MNRLLPCLLSLVLPLALSAQDKPSGEDKSSPPPYTGMSEPQWEAQAHTTDCSKAPNRVIFNDCMQTHRETHSIELINASNQNDANEILVAVRNIADPSVKIFLLSSQNVIVLSTYPQDFPHLEALVHSLDRPHRAYRVTYTLVSSDAGKRIGIQHYSMVVVSGQRTTMKEGSKVPVVTGVIGKEKEAQQQFQYLDVGLSFDATLTQTGPNLQLKTKVEQSSLLEPQLIGGVMEPVIRQSVTEGASTLVPGKPLTLGAIDVPGSTRHIDIEVVAEPVS